MVEDKPGDRARIAEWQQRQRRRERFIRRDRDDKHIVAVACDTALAGLAVPVLPLDDAAAIARFILAHFQIEAA